MIRSPGTRPLNRLARLLVSAAVLSAAFALAACGDAPEQPPGGDYDQQMNPEQDERRDQQ